MPIIPDEVVRSMFLPQLSALRESIFSRVLPTFDSIGAEAKAIEADAYVRLSARTTENTDGGDLAEAAFDAGLRHYHLMSETRQAVINVFAVAVAHLFEQQRHLLPFRTLSEAEPSSPKRERSFDALLEAHAIDARTFIHRSKLEELDLVSNVVKHAEGRSAKALRSLRPELFSHPSLQDASFSPPPVEPVHRPLMGTDLFVQPSDLRDYINAIESFWRFVLNRLTS
jgi:hypothetical protein